MPTVKSWQCIWLVEVHVNWDTVQFLVCYKLIMYPHCWQYGALVHLTKQFTEVIPFTWFMEGADCVPGWHCRMCVRDIWSELFFIYMLLFETLCVVFQCKMRSVEFHPTAQVLLAAGATNQTLSLFQVGGSWSVVLCLYKAFMYDILKVMFIMNILTLIYGSMTS